jgi:hypothetical protein
VVVCREGILNVAALIGVGSGTVQWVKREMALPLVGKAHQHELSSNAAQMPPRPVRTSVVDSIIYRNYRLAEAGLHPGAAESPDVDGRGNAWLKKLTQS